MAVVTCNRQSLRGRQVVAVHIVHLNGHSVTGVLHGLLASVFDVGGRRPCICSTKRLVHLTVTVAPELTPEQYLSFGRLLVGAFPRKLAYNNSAALLS